MRRLVLSFALAALTSPAASFSFGCSPMLDFPLADLIAFPVRNLSETSSGTPVVHLTMLVQQLVVCKLLRVTIALRGRAVSFCVNATHK